MSFQIYTIGGNLTRDPEMRYVGQNAVTRFSIAINKKTRDGERTLYFDIECWDNEYNKTATNVAEYKRKGDYVVCIGEIDIDEWDDKDTGKKVRKYFVKAREVKFEGPPQNDDRPRRGDDRDERPRRSRDDDRPRRRDDRDDEDRRAHDEERYKDLPF